MTKFIELFAAYTQLSDKELEECNVTDDALMLVARYSTYHYRSLHPIVIFKIKLFKQ